MLKDSQKRVNNLSRQLKEKLQQIKDLQDKNSNFYVLIYFLGKILDINKVLDVNNSNLISDIKSYKEKIFSLKEQVNLYKDFAYNVKNKDMNDFFKPS